MFPYKDFFSTKDFYLYFVNMLSKLNELHEKINTKINSSVEIGLLCSEICQNVQLKMLKFASNMQYKYVEILKDMH